ncbi:MAG: STAS domain-containing protein [Alphaproteobacteria bacterium]|nr:STAS domain-containing protein [Alphaproteobacteria bacterium]
MPADLHSVIPALIEQHHQELLQAWIGSQRRGGAAGLSLLDNATINEQARRFLDELRRSALSGQVENIDGPEWAGTREVLEQVSRSRSAGGSSASQTATFVFSLKEPLFNLLREHVKDAEGMARETLIASLLLDKLGLYTTELAQRSRDEVIARQQEEMLELSTPVIELWDGILALPLIGTLDSARTQIVMENLLQRIVDSRTEIAIIDITGVPTVDTLVAQHLLKTISAARLMGADCIISGIRPQIAQTIVHLGVELDVISKATMADAFALALRRIGKTVTDRVVARRPEA